MIIQPRSRVFLLMQQFRYWEKTGNRKSYGYILASDPHMGESLSQECSVDFLVAQFPNCHDHQIIILRDRYLNNYKNIQNNDNIGYVCELW